jgi:hypothetical protein
LTLSAAGCGGDDKFENEPRPPITTQLTGVITESEVTVSPDTVPLPPEPGQQESARELSTPIILILSNQTDASHTITLSGKPRDLKQKPIEVRTPQINPGDTAQIQQTLPPGTYEVRAGSEQARDPGELIAPAKLTVNPNRQTSSDDLQLP